MLLNKASPKAISRRTSYLRVRLEFLRYPQVIRILFNEYRFGPPLDFTQASTCSWIGHTVSGLLHDTLSFALFKLGFPSAPYLTQYLTSHHTHNSLDRSTKSTISSLNALYLLVNIGFQVLFHSPPGVLFNFPSRYFFTIGYQGVFSLGRWSALLPARFLVSCRTLDSTSSHHHFAYWTFTVFGVLSQNTSAMTLSNLISSPQPQKYFYLWFGLLRFRSPLLSESISLSSPGGTQMFQFPPYPLYTVFISVQMLRVLFLAGCPIQTSVDHGIFASPHSFSQLVASFVGS